MDLVIGSVAKTITGFFGPKMRCSAQRDVSVFTVDELVQFRMLMHSVFAQFESIFFQKLDIA